MKVALCFHGNAGFKEKLRGNELKELEPLDISKPIESIKRNLINHYDTYVFIHSWSEDRSDEIIKKLSPKNIYLKNTKNLVESLQTEKTLRAVNITA